MNRFGGLADDSLYGIDLEEPPIDPRAFTSDWARQAAANPGPYEPNVGMFPSPHRKPIPDLGPPLIGDGGQFSAGTRIGNRMGELANTAGEAIVNFAVPQDAMDVGLSLAGMKGLRRLPGVPTMGGIIGSTASDEAEAAKRIKGKVGFFDEKGDYPPGHILHGSRVPVEGRVLPPWEDLTAANLSPVAPSSPQIGSILKNTVENPKLREKAEKIWHTYPQYGEQYPDVGPPALREKAPDPKNPGKWLIAPKKGEIPYSSMEEALAKAEEDNFFLEKKLTPEALQFQKQRNIVQKDMDLHGYNKYFDPAKRTDIPESDYGPFTDTAVAASPKSAKTDAEWTAKYGTDEARARLQEGYAKGKSLGNAENWYYMKQLQDKYVEVLGAKEGKEAFKKEFSGMMAATTGGASPYNNFLMSQYAGYLNKLGQRVDQRAYEMPFPIGGRFASGNMDQAQKYIDSGMVGFDPAKNPKRYDFDNALAGDRNAGVIDEQMSGAFIPGMTIPEWYGPATRILREEAAKAGTDARAFQDVGWAGLKAMKTEAAAAAKAAKRAKGGMGHNSEPFEFDYEGPMIDQINRSIETTHRLTGMPIEEIVVRGLIKKEIPMYGIGAGALGLVAGDEDKRNEMMGALARQDGYGQR